MTKSDDVLPEMCEVTKKSPPWRNHWSGDFTIWLLRVITRSGNL
jgi:hypothetical protein